MAVDEIQVTKTMTPSEVFKLYEDKIQRLKVEHGQVDKDTRDSVLRRDQAEHEIAQLTQEKAVLTEEIFKLKQAQEDQRRVLAEHRTNLEASLATQEQEAQAIIQKASDAQTASEAQAQTARQLRAQVSGLKQTLLNSLDVFAGDIATSLQKAKADLQQIPD